MIDERQIGIERDETDYVSGWILNLAIGMIVLGTAFAVLDWCDLLPPLPATADSHLTHATVIKGMSDGAGLVRLSRERLKSYTREFPRRARTYTTAAQ
jgi:hypothetical protein